jgi:hypothetical protein
MTRRYIYFYAAVGMTVSILFSGCLFLQLKFGGLSLKADFRQWGCIRVGYITAQPKSPGGSLFLCFGVRGVWLESV